jgi:hypothetical protein
MCSSSGILTNAKLSVSGSVIYCDSHLQQHTGITKIVKGVCKRDNTQSAFANSVAQHRHQTSFLHHSIDTKHHDVIKLK